MGIKQVELVPLNGPTSTVPVAKDGSLKFFQLARTETTGVLKVVLPAQATIIGFLIFGAASNAGTTATVSFGSTAANANEYVNAQDVKTAGGLVIPTSTLSTNLPNIETIPQGGDLLIYAKYAETGGASSAGGPWKIAVWYIV